MCGRYKRKRSKPIGFFPCTRHLNRLSSSCGIGEDTYITCVQMCVHKVYPELQSTTVCLKKEKYYIIRYLVLGNYF